MANLRTDNLYGVSGPDTNGSALFDGSNHLVAANATAFRVNQGSSEDFTIEAWIYLTATPDGANARIASIYHTSGNQRSYMFYVHTDDQLKFNYASSGTAGSVSTLAGGTVPHNEWVHVAVTHDASATTVRLFKNGLLMAADTGAHATYYANTSGDFTTGEDFTGNISNLHITRGTCKYFDTFTPSKQPIEEDSNTTVLCLNSSIDVLNDDKSNVFSQSAADGVKKSTLMPFSRNDDGVTFDGPISMNSLSWMNLPTGKTDERGGSRGVCAGGSDPSGRDNDISFIDIQSQGNAMDFGDLSMNSHNTAGFSSKTRAVFSLGYIDASPNVSNTLEFITMMTQGNATDFGDVSVTVYESGAASNNTRGLIAGGYNASPLNNVTNIDFVTIATQGNGSDFGDLTLGRRGLQGCGSPTRSVFASGYQQPDTGTLTDTIDYVTIGTAGNAQDFGNLTSSRWGTAACADSTRGVFFGGLTPSSLNVIDFITIATTGNATDFGDLTAQAGGRGSSTSNSIRGVHFHGIGSYINAIGFVIIQTTGDEVDFGDNTYSSHGQGSGSTAHGGLS